ncbi:hypothetical protein F2Q69_00016822 [Brassica cretica]|uniref:MULE transposase domain-containing protein n=1 Tax=Brassica cretica TaxID=69181 RepID=A0A8S9QWY7_BRACR|nr:hypothetical protein F2Q69_00016822 [Brassica cretica]
MCLAVDLQCIIYNGSTMYYFLDVLWVFPLAFAVVDAETDESWHWFLAKVERIIADSNALTIISYRNNSLLKAKQIVFPKAPHRACIVHIMRNVVSRFKNKETYAGVIYPEDLLGDHPLPPPIERLSLQPPKTRRPSGHPKDKRIPSTGEIQVPKKTKLNRCGRCGVSGHNRTNCKVPI